MRVRRGYASRSAREDEERKAEGRWEDNVTVDPGDKALSGVCGYGRAASMRMASFIDST